MPASAGFLIFKSLCFHKIKIKYVFVILDHAEEFLLYNSTTVAIFIPLRLGTSQKTNYGIIRMFFIHFPKSGHII